MKTCSTCGGALATESERAAGAHAECRLPRAVVVRASRGRGYRAAIEVAPGDGHVHLLGSSFTASTVTLDEVFASRPLDRRFGVLSPESRGNALALLEKVRRLVRKRRSAEQIQHAIEKGDLR